MVVVAFVITVEAAVILFVTARPVPAPSARIEPEETTSPAVVFNPAASNPPKDVEVEMLVMRRRFVVVVPREINPLKVEVELAP